MYENNYLKHYGVKGMKWGVRRARKANEKVDKSFNKWKEESAKKENAINLGKQNNLNRMAYNANRKDKNLKAAYKQSNKAYKKALRSNTTYRKGSIREAVRRRSEQ